MNNLSSVYETPFRERYASKAMLALFSADTKFTTWRRLWIALADAEKELGLPITEDQIAEMRQALPHIDYEYAREMEKKFRHDVMAHVHTYGKAAPLAMPIIHLGATSCYVGDNADIIIIRNALELVISKLGAILTQLKGFALKYKALPTLGFTHFQPAQLTTVGKRASLWMMDLLIDLETLTTAKERLMLLGSKGTTGTQASFLELFEGDHAKVKKLEKLIAHKMGFERVQPVSGQTYSRKQDTLVLAALAGVAESAHKLASDIRLLAHLKEVEEPFEENQIGSSAMAYKRNPMRSERVCSVARFVMNLVMNGYQTHANQWFERTLDDSANRRLVISEAFLGTDSILELLVNITKNLVVYEKVIEKHIQAELPFMATENIIMQSVLKGADRQVIHEVIRAHSMKAANIIKEGGDNILLKLIEEDPAIPLNTNEISDLLDPVKFTGRANEQTEEFIAEHVEPALKKITIAADSGAIYV